jgi:hypothetical protein
MLCLEIREGSKMNEIGGTQHIIDEPYADGVGAAFIRHVR